jgi:predicted membrane protein
LQPPPRYIPGDIELFYIVRTVLSAVNITLLVVLIVTYASIYIKTRSEFTIGLLIFAIVFLMKDLAANPFVIGAFGFRLYGLGPFALLPDLFEFVALTVLLYLSVKY